MSEFDIGGIENSPTPFQGKWQPCKEAPIILFILAICSFGIGTTEFVIAGLLKILATDLNVSIPAAGWVMTSYALSVTIGAPLITACTIHIRRKYVLICLIALFILGNLISAIAETFPILIIGRILAALCHGAFFGISAVIASHIVEPSKRSMAVALMFSGLTLANVLGVPLGTLMGERLGWHLLAPLQQHLYFAGEHTSILSDIPGTMEAACESGERIARAICKSTALSSRS